MADEKIEKEVKAGGEIKVGRLGRARIIASELTTEFQERSITLMTTAFGVVAALFWQDAIKGMILTFIPPNDAWHYQLIIAIIVTFLAVISLYLLTKIKGSKEIPKK